MNEKIKHAEIIIKIKNVSDSVQDFLLFGFNQFNRKRNFGNHEDIRITTLNGYGYDAIFNSMSSVKKMIINDWKYISENTKNLREQLFHNNYILERNEFIRKEIPLILLKDPNQFQNEILQSNIDFTVNSNIHLSGKIHANSEITIALFPSLK